MTILPVTPQASNVDLSRSDDQTPSRSSDCLVVAEGNKLVIKQVSTGKILSSGMIDGEVINPRFSPDGKRIVSGCSNGTVKVWLQAAHSAPKAAETPGQTARDAVP